MIHLSRDGASAPAPFWLSLPRVLLTRCAFLMQGFFATAARLHEAGLARHDAQTRLSGACPVLRVSDAAQSEARARVWVTSRQIRIPSVRGLAPRMLIFCPMTDTHAGARTSGLGRCSRMLCSVCFGFGRRCDAKEDKTSGVSQHSQSHTRGLSSPNALGRRLESCCGPTLSWMSEASHLSVAAACMLGAASGACLAALCSNLRARSQPAGPLPPSLADAQGNCAGAASLQRAARPTAWQLLMAAETRLCESRCAPRSSSACARCSRRRHLTEQPPIHTHTVTHTREIATLRTRQPASHRPASATEAANGGPACTSSALPRCVCFSAASDAPRARAWRPGPAALGVGLSRRVRSRQRSPAKKPWLSKTSLWRLLRARRRVSRQTVAVS